MNYYGTHKDGTWINEHTVRFRDQAFIMTFDEDGTRNKVVVSYVPVTAATLKSNGYYSFKSWQHVASNVRGQQIEVHDPTRYHGFTFKWDDGFYSESEEEEGEDQEGEEEIMEG